MTDWADEAALKLLEETQAEALAIFSCLEDRNAIATALRKAKADGMRWVAQEYEEASLPNSVFGNYIRSRADAIERGE